MAAGTYNLVIDQGSDFAITLTLSEDGSAKDLSNYSARAQLRSKKTSTSVAATFTCTVTDASNGKIKMELGSASSVTVTPTGAVTATTLQGAIEQLAAQDFRSNDAPSGSNVDVGDTWYDTNDNIFYVYRTVDGVTDWVPLQTGDNADETDGGSF